MREVHHRAIDQPRASMTYQGSEVIFCCKIGRLAGLRHQIDEADLQCLRLPDCSRNPFDQQIRNETGVKRTRTDCDQIRIRNRIQCLRERLRSWRMKPNCTDPLITAADQRLAADDLPVSQDSGQRNIRRGGRKILPAIFSTSADWRTASGKSPVMCVSAVKKRLPKLWPLSPRPESNRYWKRRDRNAPSSASATMQLADIARRQHVEFAAQPARTSPIIGDSDNRSDIQPWIAGVPWMRVSLQPGEQRAERPLPPPIDTTRSASVIPCLKSIGWRGQESFYRPPILLRRE